MVYPERTQVFKEHISAGHESSECRWTIAAWHEQSHGCSDLGLGAGLIGRQAGRPSQRIRAEARSGLLVGDEVQDAADLVKVDVEAPGELEVGVFFAVDLGVNAIQSVCLPSDQLENANQLLRVNLMP